MGDDLGDLYELEEFPLEGDPLDSPVLQNSLLNLTGSFDNLKLIDNLKFSCIPAVILDSKLNILWENKSYSDLFVQENRELPVNLITEFSPFLTPERASTIYKNITDSSTGYSYKGRIESKYRDRLDIIANIIINPYFNGKSYDKNDSIPVYYVSLFDDISEENKTLIRNIFLSLLEASKLKDNDTGNHIYRVGEYSNTIASKLFNNTAYPEVNAEFIDNIYFLAPMHDVGKIGIPDDILTKPSALTGDEWKIMKWHTINGAYIFKAYPVPMAAEIATFHHEKWNGKGYPYGDPLSGSDIPLSARILAISDVYDALRMKRSYKKPFSHKKAMEIIKNDSGSHFDPDLVEIFLKYNKEFEAIYKRLKDS